MTSNLSPAVTLKLFRAAMERHVLASTPEADVSTATIEDDGPVYEWTFIYPDGCQETAHFVKAVGYIVCTLQTPDGFGFTSHGTLEQFKGEEDAVSMSC